MHWPCYLRNWTWKPEGQLGKFLQICIEAVLTRQGSQPEAPPPCTLSLPKEGGNSLRFHQQKCQSPEACPSVPAQGAPCPTQVLLGGASRMALGEKRGSLQTAPGLAELGGCLAALKGINQISTEMRATFEA